MTKFNSGMASTSSTPSTPSISYRRPRPFPIGAPVHFLSEPPPLHSLARAGFIAYDIEMGLKRQIVGLGVALGVFATISQTLLLRESLAVAGGNEMVLALGFFGWLLGVALGAGGAGYLRPSQTRLSLIGIVAPLVMSCDMVFFRLHRMVLEVPIGSEPSLLVLAGILLSGFGLAGGIIGLLFTLGARTLRGHETVSRLYVAEALGALLGGVVFSMYLASGATHLSALCLSSAILFAAFAGLNQPRFKWIHLTLLVLVFGSMFVGIPSDLEQQLHHKAFSLIRQSEHIATEESEYGRVTIGKLGEQVELLTDGRFDFAFPDAWERPSVVHFALTAHLSPSSMLIIGGGPSDRLEAALSHHLKKVVMTQLNDRALSMSRPYLPVSTQRLLTDPRVILFYGDGRRYLSRESEMFDVVLILPPEPTSAGNNRYYTKEFYSLIKKRMRKGGVLTTLSPGAANVLSPAASDVSASIRKTLRAVFDTVVPIPGIELMFHAADLPTSIVTDAQSLKKRFENRHVVGSFSGARFEETYNRDRIAAVTKQLDTASAHVNTDDRPFIFQIFLQQWERTLGEAGTRSVNFVGGVSRLAYVIIAILFLVAVGWMWQMRTRPGFPKHDAAVSIGITGGAGMSLMWAILYVLQVVKGTLYSDIALLTGLFMAGLAVGAEICRRCAFKDRRSATQLDLLMIGILLLSLPVFHLAHSWSPLLYGWSFISGGVFGAAFPLMLKRAAMGESDERPLAALIEGMDHLGAAVGVFLTGILLVPIFGIALTLFYWVGLKTFLIIGRYGTVTRSSS